MIVFTFVGVGRCEGSKAQTIIGYTLNAVGLIGVTYNLLYGLYVVFKAAHVATRTALISGSTVSATAWGAAQASIEVALGHLMEFVGIGIFGALLPSMSIPTIPEFKLYWTLSLWDAARNMQNNQIAFDECMLRDIRGAIDTSFIQNITSQTGLDLKKQIQKFFAWPDGCL